MKNVVGFISVFLVLAIVAVWTNPADQQCIKETRAYYAHSHVESYADEFFNGLAFNNLTLNINDHIFYKTIYSRLSGRKMATAAFGCVWETPN